jgi:transaldolase
VRYRILMSVAVEARDYRQAHEHAKKLSELLKGPLVKLAVEAEGIRLSEGNGRPIVHQPQREV